jgi:hypothetical protein
MAIRVRRITEKQLFRKKWITFPEKGERNSKSCVKGIGWRRITARRITDSFFGL